MRRLVIFFIFVTLVTSQQDFKIFQNYTQWTQHLTANLSDLNISSGCAEQFEELLKNDRADLWNLFDATSKFPWSGLATASKMDWGNHEQCVKIDHDYSGGNIRGKYCLFGLLIPSGPIDFNHLDPNDFYKLSVCMPDACTATDFNLILNYTSLPPLFQDTNCHTQDDLEKYTGGEIAMIVVLIIFATFMIMSTTYDVYIKKKQKKSAHPLYLAFSVYTNGRKIIQTSKGNREQIQIFNGMKTVSIAWIIAGHAMIGWNNYDVINSDAVAAKYTDIRVFYISGSQLAVDTFFYMGGFLLAYIYMKQKTKPLVAQIKSIPYLIIHRYLRLTPSVAMMYFFFITVFRHMGTGPLWDYGYKVSTDSCHKYWWSFFTYTQNYVNYKDYCLIHTWYLSADMQMFLLTIIILIPLSVLLAKNDKNLKLVMGICLVLNVFFIALPLTTKLIWTDYINTYETHSRMINYTMGITMGIFMREAKDQSFFYDKIAKPAVINLVAWIIVLVSMGTMVVIYQEIIYTEKYSQTCQAIFLSFCRPAWCVCISWMLYSSYHGYGGIVNWILTRPTLQITAKLSYCMYVMHGMIIAQGVISTKTRQYFSDWVCFEMWCAYFMLTFMVAFVWSLAFESPLITIEKLIFGGGAPPRKQKEKNLSQAAKHNLGEQFKQKDSV